MFVVEELDKAEGIVCNRKEYTAFEDLLTGLQKNLEGTTAHPAIEALKVEECTEIQLDFGDTILIIYKE
jgi:hypothetical protein